MTDRRKVLIQWDHGAAGWWLVETPEERETRRDRWRLAVSRGELDDDRSFWDGLLSTGTIDGLKQWNDECSALAWKHLGEPTDVDEQEWSALRMRGRELALRAQEELGDDWEVLYRDAHGEQRPVRQSKPGEKAIEWLGTKAIKADTERRAPRRHR